MSTYEPCVLGSDGNCTRWSHDHAADRPPVTDDARAVREAAMDLYRAMRRANPDAWAEIDEVEDWAYWDDIVRTAQVTTTNQALAEAWAEGHRTGWEHCQDGNYGSDHWDDPTPNPYTAAARRSNTGPMERRRHLAEMTRQAFADGLYETSTEDYAEALRRARGKNPAATIEDAEEVLHGAGWFARADLDPRDLRGILHDLADAGLLATARTRLTREQIAEHLRKRANDDEDHADRLYVLSAEEWDRWYDEHLTVSHQIDGKTLRIEGRPEAIADAVLALLRGGDE